MNIECESVSRSVMWDSATPWTVARQAPLCMGFSSQEYWSGFPFPTLGDLPDPGNEPGSLVSPALAGGFFITEPPGKTLGGWPEPFSSCRAWADSKSACMQILRLERSPEEGNGYPLQYSWLENPMDRGDWGATGHWVAKTQTWLSHQHFQFTSSLCIPQI